MRRCVILFILTLFLLPCVLWGQSGYNPNMHNGTVNVSCSNTYNFYDPGGPNGNYSSNQDFTQTFIAPAGQCLQVMFTSFEVESYSGTGTPYDYLTIYDGTNTSSPQVGRYYGTNSPGTIISTNGALTFVFHSDQSVNKQGWTASIHCIQCPEIINMGNGTVTTCNARFFDPGGSNANYGNNQNFTQTFVSATPDMCLMVEFSSFQLQGASWAGTPYDYLTIYDGENTSSPQIGRYYGTNSPGTIISTSGALTFVFHSNGSTTNTGWSAVITCMECSNIPCMSLDNGSPCSMATQATPFCTDENPYGVTFPSGLSGNAFTFFGLSSSDDLGCLSTAPYPAWYYMQIDHSGSLTFQIHQTSGDVDFACWGPFVAANQEDFMNSLCCGQFSFYTDEEPNNNIYNSSQPNTFIPNENAHYPYGNLVDCSYSASPNEWCHIPNAQAGEWYLVLITNYHREPGLITFSPTSTSTATTNCSLLAPMTSNAPLCEGDTLVLTCTNPQAGATYNWSGPNGWSAVTSVPTVSIPDVSASNSGQYTLQLTGISNTVNPSHIEVTIDSMPQVTLTVSQDTVCQGTQITLQASGATSYAWSPGSSTAANRTVTPSTTTTYTVTGSIGGCSATASHTVVVYATPTVTITTVPSNRTICKGDSAILIASGGATYEWLQGSDTIAYTDSVIVTPSTNTSYHVQVTSEEGCINSASKIIIVRPLPTVSISGASNLCTGDSVLLTSSSASQYEWSTGATTRSIWVSPSETSQFTVRATNSYGCSDTATHTVTVGYVPSPEVLDTALCANSFTWHDEVYTTSNTYTFQVDNAGCPYTDTLKLTLYEVENHTYTVDTCERYTWSANGSTYTESGTYPYRHINENNCWVEDTLFLTLYHAVSEVVDTALCASSYFWHGNTYTTSDTYTYTFLDEHQCWQTDTLKITFFEINHQSFTVDTCESYRWPADGNVYTQSDTYYHSHLDDNECMQVDTLHLTIYAVSHEVIEKDTCSYYDWHGTRYTEGGLYTFSAQDVHNCPYTDTLLLSLSYASPSSMSAQSCDSYEWNDSLYTESGVYLYGHEDGNGCWQVDTLHLTINRPAHVSETVSACESYEWHGTTYTQSGTIFYAQTDAHNCMQVDTLHLTVYHTAPQVEHVIVCEPYYWHNTQYGTSGTYLYNYNDQNQHNCPCTDTLYLRVTSQPELTLMAVLDATCNQNNGEVKVNAMGGTLPYQYVYMPSGATAAFENLAPGNYHLRMIDSIGCTADENFTIGNIIHQVSLVRVVDAHCGMSDGMVEVAATGGYGQFSYHWDPPITSTTNVAENVQAGQYQVTIVDSNGCSLPLAFTVRDIPGPEACFYFSVSNEQCVTLVNCTEEEGLVQWAWTFGDGQGSLEWQPTHIYDDPGQYPVVLTVVDENNCLDSLELLYVIQEMPTLYLPSAFIPESDVAENRVFRPIGNSISEQNYEMLIYDRWGRLIFVSRQLEYGWDGHINGQLAPQGTYMYKINYEDVHGIPKMVKGSVLLLR